MEYLKTTLPSQKLSMSKKDKDWREASVDAIIARSKIGGVKYQRQKIAYDIMDSNFDLEDLKYVTNPYKVEEGFPAKMQSINIITPKIRLLLGEASKRPQSFVVFRSGEASTEEILDKQKEMIVEVLSEQILMEGGAAEKQQFLQEKLAEIKEYITSKYYCPAETAADNTLKYLRAKLDLDDIFLRGFEDGLISNDEIYYVGIVNGEPYLERVNPLMFSYDRSPELKGIEEGDWAVRRMEMTASEIHDKFYDLMDEETFDNILNYISDNRRSGVNNTGATVNTNYIMWRDFTELGVRDLNEGERRGYTAIVDHAVWRSYKKIGYLTYPDEEGVLQETIVDESYKVGPGESIEWDWIDEVWEGYRVGKTEYFGIRPVQYQDYSIDEVKSIPLPYVGGWYQGNNSVGKSLVELMKPLQYFYLILFYRLELALARDRGKVLNMDITQIPKSMGIDEYKWLHYLTAMGVNFINPYEDGWDIPGTGGGKPSQFNQMTAVDLTMANVIVQYIELMNKIEEMLGELCGVSKARQGQIHQSSLVGNVRQEITQSSHITEYLFWRHSRNKTKAVSQLLDVAKYAWKRSDKKRLNYILSGAERVFININDDFIYSDFDVFVSDSTKEYQDIQELKELYQPAMQNGATLLDVSNIMTSTTISEIKTKLERLERKRQEMAKQAQEAEMQIAQNEQMLKKEELRIKEEDSIRKAQTSIQVALIGQEGNEEMDIDTEDNTLDIKKLELQKEKQDRDYQLKLKDLQEKERSNRAKEQISRSTKNKSTK